ncbi:hypothetical protein J7M28_03055 [bacterium]|nr:hypothetical protein [bacterium]
MRHNFVEKMALVLFAVVFAASILCMGSEVQASDETYTGISKDRSCTWWLPESQEVSKDDRDQIEKLFKAFEKKLEKDGVNSVTLPWQAPDEAEEPEEEAKKEKELTDEQKKWEENQVYEDPDRSPNVFFLSKGDLNIVKIDGVPTGTLFVVRGTFDKPRIDVWRVKLAKEDDEWIMKSKEVEYSFDLIHFMTVKDKSAYKFNEIKIDHDCMHISMKKGTFYPLYAGHDKIIGGTIFGKGTMNYFPPTKLAKNWETTQEPDQLLRHTKNLLGKKRGTKELKNAKITKFTFYFTPTNFDRYVKLDGLEKIGVSDKKELEDAKDMINGEIDWLAKTDWDVKLPYKGQPDGEKHVVKLYYLPDYDELCDLYMYSPKYFNVGYYDYPPGPANQEEISLYANRDILLKFGDDRAGGAWGGYNRKEQRENLTRREAEYEPVDKINMYNRRVDLVVTGKDERLESMVGKSGMVTKFRATCDFETLMQNTRVVAFSLSGAGGQRRRATPMNVKKVVDEKGLDILRMSSMTLVFPPLRKGQMKSFTAEYSGYLMIRIRTGDTFTSGNSTWYPNYGYLSCATMQVVLGVPKRYRGITVGVRKGEEWEDGKYRYSHWGSDKCIKLAAVLMGDYQILERDFARPDGSTFKFYFYYTPNMTYYSSEGDYYGFSDRHRDTGTRSESWRSAGKYHRINFAIKDPESVVTEFESIMAWLQAIYHRYPYDKIAAVMMPIYSWYGQGFPTILTLDGTSFMSEGDKAKYDGFFRGLGSGWGARFWDHEAGHQYWGHVVGWFQPRDQWISEAFTEHQSGMYYEASRDPKEYKACLDEWKYTAIKWDDQGSISLGGGRLGDAYIPMIYNKGPWMVHMIRKAIGDKNFQIFCKNLLKSMEWKNPTSSDVLDVLQAMLGKEGTQQLFGTDNMDWFFDQWLYGTGIPSYDYGWKSFKKDGEYFAKIRIKHKDVQFRVRIPIFVHGKDGSVYGVPLILTGEKPIEEFEIKLRGPAKKLVLDEFEAVLTKKIKKVSYRKLK